MFPYVLLIVFIITGCFNQILFSQTSLHPINDATIKDLETHDI